MSRGGRLHRLGLVGLALMACADDESVDSANSAASVDSAEVCTIVTWQDYTAQAYPYICASWKLCDDDWHYASLQACVEFQTERTEDTPQVYAYWGCGPFDPDKGCEQLARAKEVARDCDAPGMRGEGYLMEPACSPTYD